MARCAAPVAPEAFVCTVLVQSGPDPEAGAVSAGRHSQMRLFCEDLLLEQEERKIRREVSFFKASAFFSPAHSHSTEKNKLPGKKDILLSVKHKMSFVKGIFFRRGPQKTFCRQHYFRITFSMRMK